MVIPMAHRTGQSKYLTRLLFLSLLAPALAQNVNPPPSPTYAVIELPLKPQQILNSGEIVGTTLDDHAAAWSRKGGLRILPGLKNFAVSEARGSDQAGDVVGWASGTAGDAAKAFLYSHEQVTWLAPAQSKALAINDAGIIAGESSVKGRKTIQPVSWEKRSIIDLGGCCGGTARAINAKAQVVGDVYDEQGRYRAFLWDHVGGLRLLGLPGDYGSAVAINDSGHILLQQRETGVFLYRGENDKIRLEAPRKLPTEGRALNNSDAIVGAFGPFFDEYRAFIWDARNGFRDLNDLIPRNSGWKLQYATGINDRGEIVGVGDFQEKDDVGFLLVEQEPVK
jgi:uncharacterized membrane protein